MRLTPGCPSKIIEYIKLSEGSPTIKNCTLEANTAYLKR
jgi:hypothetical protein